MLEETDTGAEVGREAVDGSEVTMELGILRVFFSFSLVSVLTVPAPACCLEESHLTKGRFESLTVSPPGNLRSSRALSELGLNARLEGLGAMGLKGLTGWTEAMGMFEETLL